MSKRKGSTNPDIGRNQHHLKPSERTPTKSVPVPAGCIEVWQVRELRNSQPANPYENIFREKQDAFDLADQLWSRHRGRSGPRIFVDMKAAMLVGERYHIMYKNAIRFAAPLFLRSETTTDEQVRNPPEESE